MEPVERHPYQPDASFDGVDLNCGNGLLLLIRKHIDPLEKGQLLEIRSTEISVDEDLPSWCRMTGNDLVSWTRAGGQRSFLVSKGPFSGKIAAAGAASIPIAASQGTLPAAASVRMARDLPAPAPAPAIAPLSVMGIGSWPRPRWMVEAIHEHLEGRLPEREFQATADDAVRLAVQAQLRAEVGVVTDGEQRRDSYSSFVGGILDNCQLIPLTDLLPLVDDPERFREELLSLDVPAAEVRHPAVFGPLGRSRPLAVHELEFVKTLTGKPVKVALPGPYTLTRTMWMECISDRAYRSREHLAEDLVKVLREELHFLLAAGAALVQFDEPVLSEAVYTGAKNTRSFMCGALSEKGDAAHELAFAGELIRAVVAGLPRERLGLHICRGNWSADETAMLSGDYRPLLPYLATAPVGTLFLELSTPRAGEMDILKDLAGRYRIGVGVVNQKQPHIETAEEIVVRVEKAMHLFGEANVLLTPDCGFATYADNPVSSAETAEAKLRAMVAAVAKVRGAT
jgi:5-methyltetrahydropteroyltriglutamate--homocysteine methyltransferase